MQSPRTPAAVVVVKNTFVEVVDENENMEESTCVPAFRRRRGSSFFRSSSEPRLEGERVRLTVCDDPSFDGISTEDADTECGLSTPEVSPRNSAVSSRATSPAPACFPAVWPTHDVAYVPEPATFPRHAYSGMNDPILTAAVNASFNAGFMAARNAPPPRHVAFPTFGGHAGQMPLLLGNSVPKVEARNTSFSPTLQLPASSLRAPSPQGCCSSNSSDAGTVASNQIAEGKSSCHLIWCDHRAFKETSSTLKDQLESKANAQAKTHKTSENCIRLFRKKQRAQGRPPCVILASWANAPALLSYLAEAPNVNAKVVVLCDARSCRKNESADQLAAQFPFVDSIATTWDEALESVAAAVASFQ
jgi:hypothetical protein